MSSYEDYENGTLVQYQFLWSHEVAQGREDGTKRRPCAIILRSPNPAADRIFLIPITTKESDSGTPTIEVPELEARRIGLIDPLRRWVILNVITRQDRDKFRATKM